MYCDILDSFCLKPNGDVPCEDDIGDGIVLGRIPEAGDWSPDAFFRSGKYVDLRAAAAANRLPWGDTCRQCAQLQPRHWKARLLRRHIRKFQIEPTMLCRLRCPCCGNRDQLATRGGARNMPLDLLERVLAGFRREGYRIDYVEWAGWGDPLLHPGFSALVTVLRRNYPRTLQRVITNGNYDFAATLGGHFVEHLVVSCDGARQESYEKYRIRGNIDQVFRFMADAVRLSPRTRVIWKYILFEFNDTDEEIRLAQAIADRLGVHEMRFVLTGTKYRSQRFHYANMHALPQVRSNVSLRLNPIMSRIDQFAQRTNSSALARTAGIARARWHTAPLSCSVGAFGRVFTTRFNDQRHLVVEAWAGFLRRTPIGTVDCRLNGALVGHEAIPTPQVPFARRLARVGLRYCRMRFSQPLAQPLPPTFTLEIREANTYRARVLLRGTFQVRSVREERIG